MHACRMTGLGLAKVMSVVIFREDANDSSIRFFSFRFSSFLRLGLKSDCF